MTRRTEPRIAAQVWAALGDAQTVLNVGAGTGSYEPPGRDVTAVEPSAVMRAQRPVGAAPCVDAVAESLPFEDQSFDAAMAVATIDHWQDPVAGLREMRRVARRVVVFTKDFSDPDRFWLNRDYLPEYSDLQAGRQAVQGNGRFFFAGRRLPGVHARKRGPGRQGRSRWLGGGGGVAGAAALGGAAGAAAWPGSSDSYDFTMI